MSCCHSIQLHDYTYINNKLSLKESLLSNCCEMLENINISLIFVIN